MEQNLVSIIIPVYNVEPYLNACIASVCAQTYRNIEVILVDDGSTDRSSEICDEWSKRDDRIFVIHKENGGLSSARNAGLESAKGVYVLFTDGDDTIGEKLLEKTIPHMDLGFETVSFGYELVFESKDTQRICFPEKEYLLETERQKEQFILGPFFKYEVGWNVWNRVFRRDYTEKFKIRFVDTARIFAEDQHFCLCYLAHCSRIKVLSDCLYQYYQRSDSIMGTSRRLSQIHIGQKNELARILRDYYLQWNDCKHLLAVFPWIHYLLLERAIQDLEREPKTLDDIRNGIWTDVEKRSDISFFEQELKQISGKKRIMLCEYSPVKVCIKMDRVKMLLKKRSIVYPLYLKAMWLKNHRT